MIGNSVYKVRKIMPTPLCYECAVAIPLDTITYWNYRGEVPCDRCKFKMHVVISGGHMLESGPVIPSDYVSGLHDGIPEQSIGDYFEAITCLVHGAFKASAVMQRRSLQGALLAHNVPEDTPMKMIHWAQSNGILLGPRDVSLAITVSFFGGKGAHPEEDGINLVGEMEAIQGLRVTKGLLLVLFEEPEPPVGTEFYASLGGSG